MAEYQNTVVSAGEVTQRFIEFVLMQAQSAAFMLGQIPHPQTGKPETNLEMAKLLIDQLVMIQEKTKGNLNSDETRILGGTISNLQLSYVEAIRGHSPTKQATPRRSKKFPRKRARQTTKRSLLRVTVPDRHWHSRYPPRAGGFF
jgi:Domain of unknown function (DUF1844)